MRDKKSIPLLLVLAVILSLGVALALAIGFFGFLRMFRVPNYAA